ncbi:MAG: NUDIX hydrolase [Flavobacteriales bacterium]
MSSNHYPFVVRVYGVIVDAQRGYLVSDEFVFGQKITKFAGGGLEFGEGTVDCLKRELMEEVGQEFDVLGHFYTTDFFVPSAFNSKVQVISVYYSASALGDLAIGVSEKPFDFKELVEGAQSFRWVPFDRIGPETFTLEIDQHVGSMLKASRQ